MNKEIILILTSIFVFFFLMFWGIRFFVGKMLKHDAPIGTTRSQETQDEIHQRIQDIKEQTDDLRDAQQQKLDDFKTQQADQASRTSDLQQRQKDLMEQQKERMRDMQRR